MQKMNISQMYGLYLLLDVFLLRATFYLIMRDLGYHGKTWKSYIFQDFYFLVDILLLQYPR